MRGHGNLLGLYVPGRSVLHRAPLWLKVFMSLALSAVVLAARVPELTAVGLVAASLGLTLGARTPAAQLFRTVLPLLPVLGVLAVYHVIANGLLPAFVTTGNILTCVLAARTVTLTTPGQELLDGVVFVARPVRVVGGDPERFGLALSILLRSIPYLAGSLLDVRDAARARGLERSVRASVVPVVINAVAYAHRTGEALAARGLGEDDRPEDPGA
ncbi:energy-coupling factor transporter transmembrane component T family protein [Arthrobacter sp. H41]|uniref:energy-coupling factor transporter transmembrane component T family protein n=1 Tax=Arthrobacter sp. H41 TaxID=1312978 RepID=UPI0004795C66|nr:energy-coupling factor transporter transmembrane protein EcfT [Arthrobacter sp. H41]